MPRKRTTRELAMQVLYLWDTGGDAEEPPALQLLADACDDAAVRLAALDMARATWEQRQAADRWVERLAPQWPTHRQPTVDRNLLRLAIWEMTNSPTPPKLVIDSAIELAKAYSTQHSAAFVNGVLDAVLKEHRELCGDATLADKINGPEPGPR